ncbi:MAG: glycosyltransferase family 39 protein, partial [Candidatus Eiseniibacteriota bacterium]
MSASDRNPPLRPLPSAMPAAQPPAIGVLALMSGLKIALHLPAMTQYGWFRDELYYFASTYHLAWGYVEHPPLSIAILTLVRVLLGDSLVAVRLVPLLAGVATVWLTGTLAARLGGGRFAQALAALATVLAPVFLALDHYYSMNALDILLWVIAAHATLTALDRQTLRAWCVLGLVLGLGFLNKISMFWFAGGLAAAVILTPHRRVLATRGPWLAAALALLLFAPHVIWQERNHWPLLEFMHNATSRKMAPISTTSFLLRQMIQMNPGTVWLW